MTNYVHAGDEAEYIVYIVYIVSFWYYSPWYHISSGVQRWSSGDCSGYEHALSTLKEKLIMLFGGGVIFYRKRGCRQTVGGVAVSGYPLIGGVTMLRHLLIGQRSFMKKSHLTFCAKCYHFT